MRGTRSGCRTSTRSTKNQIQNCAITLTTASTRNLLDVIQSAGRTVFQPQRPGAQGVDLLVLLTNPSLEPPEALHRDLSLPLEDGLTIREPLVQMHLAGFDLRPAQAVGPEAPSGRTPDHEDEQARPRERESPGDQAASFRRRSNR